MAKPKFYKTDKIMHCDMPCPPEEDMLCPNHPDLCMLRDAAADERGAVADYLECALDTCLDEVFLDVAEDEMQHYVETMRLISALDPVQAQMLEDEDLGFLTMKKSARHTKAKWGKPKAVKEVEDVEVIPPNKKEICAIRCLTKAIQDELHAINKYQRYLNEAKEPEVKALFCHLMNEEKEHVAEFTAVLFEITHEPLPEEED